MGECRHSERSEETPHFFEVTLYTDLRTAIEDPDEGKHHGY
jgi:hypothetical protein